jgi:spore maturation protein CgeB
MRIVYFTHSLLSCWNHGNAHFLRGVLRELVALGHDVRICEPRESWSRENLLADHGPGALEHFAACFPELAPTLYASEAEVEAALEGADVVVVHEWNEPGLVAALGRRRAHGAGFRLYFHDTHHRAVSAPEQMTALDLGAYDGVLAFGETLAEVYHGWGWGRAVHVWHEAADTRLFAPPADEAAGERQGLVWIGNWGDGERSAELRTFLIDPPAAVGLPLSVYGVRYPEQARRQLAASGARYLGWTPNSRVPEIFARHLATLHVPRRFYVEALPGIPTIRVFEALACGIPLVCSPWSDSEGLFREGTDYLVARDGGGMRRHLRALAADPALREALARSGLETIRARHTCAHRARQLLEVVRADGAERDDSNSEVAAQ